MYDGTLQYLSPLDELVLMKQDFAQVGWDEQLVDDLRQLIRLAVREDLDRYCDWTTVSLVPQDAKGKANIVSREHGIISGLAAIQEGIDELNADLQISLHAKDGDQVEPKSVVATLSGSARDILTTERILLNLVGRCSGIASLTRQFVDLVSHTKVRIYDTRKTTPGWRRLEKWAVGTGGGTNHRAGLYAAVMIKDNHLAHSEDVGITPAQAVTRAREFLKQASNDTPIAKEMIVQVEVDTIEQLKLVASAKPDIVLLDNMSCEQLVECVQFRDDEAQGIELEASGGVNLSTVKGIAETGVDRVSIGALTHSATNFDVGLDWLD